MKALLSLLLTLAAAAAYAANCGNTVNVLFVFSPEAVTAIAALPGAPSPSAFAQDQITASNNTLANSQALTRYSSAGVRTSIPLTGMPPFYTLPGDGDAKQMAWVQGNTAILKARDTSSADLIVVVTNNTGDMAGVSTPGCLGGTSLKVARNGTVGVNVWALSQNPRLVGHLLAHQLCMEHGSQANYGARYRYQSGDSANACSLYWTAEQPVRVTGDSSITSTVYVTTQCWKFGGAGSCYPSGYSASRSGAVPPNSAYTPAQCMWYGTGYQTSPSSPGAPIAGYTQWHESLQCSNGTLGTSTYGYDGYYVSSSSQPSTSTFQCTGGGPINYWSNPSVYYDNRPLAQTGDTGTVARIDANVGDVSCYRNSPLAPKVISAVQSAVESSQ